MTGIRHTDVKDFWKKSCLSNPQSLCDSHPLPSPSPGGPVAGHRPAP